MNIDFELYRIFYVVANNESVTKASEELSISQPAITKSIKKLESQLGGQLFTRTSRGVILTEEGREFYKYIKQAIDFIKTGENIYSDLINLETGCIRIGISTTLAKEFLIPYLKDFRKLYPKIDIKIFTYTTRDLIPMLRNGLIDMIVLNLPYKEDKDINIISCKTIQDCFVVNKDYIEITNKKIKLKDLEKYPTILQLKKSNTREFLDDFCSKNNVKLNPSIELASYGLVLEFTKIGFGIGYATKEYIKDELKNGILFELDIEPKLPKREIGIATMKNILPSFSTKKLIDMVVKKANI